MNKMSTYQEMFNARKQAMATKDLQFSRNTPKYKPSSNITSSPSVKHLQNQSHSNSMSFTNKQLKENELPQ